MIKSILDNDLYKFTMQYAVMTLFPRAKAKYEFINRANTVFPADFTIELRKEIDKLAMLELTDEEKDYFAKKCPYLPPTYFDFLKGYRYNPDEVDVEVKDGQLKIMIEGYWYRTILWEVPLMAIISELYFKMMEMEPWSNDKIISVLDEKIKLFNNLGISFADFGTRRRFSLPNHDLVVENLKTKANGFVGTSNVFLSMKYNVTPIGTHAHEWFMFHAAKYGFKMANKLALENWVKIYRGDLGIALSDTFTSDAFFLSFDTKLAKLFDGVRQDSGDPIEFGYKTIAHYDRLNIDPTTKTIIFSDALNPKKVAEIVEEFKGKIRLSFGIGTNLTNDVGVKPLNIVIKMIEALPEGRHWVPTVKISDSKGKYTGDPEMIKIALKMLDIEE